MLAETLALKLCVACVALEIQEDKMSRCVPHSTQREEEEEEAYFATLPKTVCPTLVYTHAGQSFATICALSAKNAANNYNYKSDLFRMCVTHSQLINGCNAGFGGVK
ncbi:unnamed protein product [Ceratitis capitata]|uniref:(Mediterranean fruit fly) hypothetical protein n=1 Tax=Ceratitis capitata TaxID=7213 RepID=A0A811UTK8_CERCA|nr:unnamed protein product [Ceratitis capitata]